MLDTVTIISSGKRHSKLYNMPRIANYHWMKHRLNNPAGHLPTRRCDCYCEMFELCDGRHMCEDEEPHCMHLGLCESFLGEEIFVCPFNGTNGANENCPKCSGLGYYEDAEWYTAKPHKDNTPHKVSHLYGIEFWFCGTDEFRREDYDVISRNGNWRQNEDETWEWIPAPEPRYYYPGEPCVCIQEMCKKCAIYKECKGDRRYSCEIAYGDSKCPWCYGTGRIQQYASLEEFKKSGVENE